MKAFAAIPTPIAQEKVSTAYIRAIAAQAGLNIKTSEWDNGIDLEIGSHPAVIDGFKMQNLWISMQLKATSNWEIRQDRIAFFLQKHNYDMLRQPSITRQYLILYTMPSSKCRANWLIHQQDHTQFMGKTYFLDLLDQPEITPNKRGIPRTGKTVYIPSQNRLTAGSLKRIYTEFANWTVKKMGLK